MTQDASERQEALSDIVAARAEDAREAILRRLLSYGGSISPAYVRRFLLPRILALADQVRTPHEKRPFPQDAMEST